MVDAIENQRYVTQHTNDNRQWQPNEERGEETKKNKLKWTDRVLAADCVCVCVDAKCLSVDAFDVMVTTIDQR